MKLSRPSRFALACLIIGTFCSLNDIYEAISQALIVIPIYHVGYFTIIWQDYLTFTIPVSIAWLVLGYATWAKGADTVIA